MDVGTKADETVLACDQAMKPQICTKRVEVLAAILIQPFVHRTS